MQEVMKYPSGTFSWIDLATTDAAAAKEFYTQLFGWSAQDMPAGPDNVYTMLNLEGRPIAGLYQMRAEQQAQEIPPNWLSYVSVDAIEATAEKVTSLGGTVLTPPFDVMEAGRMAVVQDPTGAVFALWQAGQHIGAKLVNIPGTLSWNELATHDTDRAGAFYTSLFGWETQTMSMPNDTTYTSFQNQGRMAGGMLQIEADWGDMPSSWSVYFAVADCDATVSKAQELGGTVQMPPTDIPDVGRFAMLQDPQGAWFTIIKMSIAEPPPGYEAHE